MVSKAAAAATAENKDIYSSTEVHFRVRELMKPIDLGGTLQLKG